MQARTTDPADGGRGGSRPRAVFDWFFRDRRSGRIVVAQVPNLPLLIWVGTIVLRRFMESGTTARDILEWAGWLALGWWSIDELFRGLNPWRRLLGLVGCAAVGIGLVSSLAP